MALFNKLFTNRKSTHARNPDNVSEKLFAFSKDQVRVVLFRECDFRGRKLLFDTSSVKKVPLNQKPSKDNEKFSEISDGFGYIYTKPQPDFNQLAEMVFGSVAMSFRGTYFKMHILDTPHRLMFTQVFSSPRLVTHGRVSVSSRSDPHSLEHSNKLDDSGASSTASMSEQLSVHSTTSDTILVCRRHGSTPLDVPTNHNGQFNSNPSLIGDSGYYADHSNISSGPSTTWGSVNSDHGNSTFSLSSSSLYKKWLRRASTSLDTSGLSLPSLGSTQEGFAGRNHRTSKLGLSIILQLTPGQEEELTQFFMEHVSLMEAMLWRARQVVEMAYIKSQNFASMMVEMANLSAQYLVNLLSGSYLSMNLWLSLSNGCDHFNSISAFSSSSSALFSSSDDLSLSGLLNKTEHSVPDFTLFNLGKLIKNDWDPFNFKKSFFGEHRNLTAGKFVQDFCELLESIDVKDTNFFISTLVTAVLTHHLGWVNTCLPHDKNRLFEHKGPFNPLWGELTDLFGAVGHPTKMSQTIITGTMRKDLISKILITMTYFIRCCDVFRQIPIRADIQEENKMAEVICQKYSCIPKENYKKYEDHLKEIMNSNVDFFNNNNCSHKNLEDNVELVKCLNQDIPIVRPNHNKGLSRTKTCLDNLIDLEGKSNESSLYPQLSDFNKTYSSSSDSLYPNLQMETDNLTSDQIKKKVNTLARVPSSAVLCHLDTEISSKLSIVDHIGRPLKLDMEKQMRSNDLVVDKNDVVFVLGDNEQLVGLKKEKPLEIGSASNQRPSYLDLSKQLLDFKGSCGDFKDADFAENLDKNVIKPSTSWTSLSDETQIESGESKMGDECAAGCYSSNKYARSQSVPPEDRKVDENPKNKSKFRYSGVKFNLQQYPQILSNYMKSKNLEISNLHFGDKGFKIDELSSLSDTINAKYPSLDTTYEDCEALQTPSNASELEFTSDLCVAPPVPQQAKESCAVESQLHSTFIKQHVPNTTVKESEQRSTEFQKMRVVNLPMPKSQFLKPPFEPIRYTSSLMRAPSENYMPDMILQGPVTSKQNWESKLKSDLALASQHSLIDQPIEEAVAIIANTDSWEVQLMSSHTFVIDKGSSGIRVGMSQLVANMLESLLQMWKLNVPPHYCLVYIEQTLQELCVRSKALAEMLLATEFCSMEQLTSTLQLEVNDVPLLLAVASTHTPQVTQKYGLSFQ